MPERAEGPPDSRYDLRVGAWEEYPKISLGTVYRNLSLLVDQGEILRFSCGEGQDHYDADTSQHYHFVCKKCRAVSDLHMPPLEHIDVLAKDGFDGEIDGHFVLFYGTCGKCKKMKKIVDKAGKVV